MTRTLFEDMVVGGQWPETDASVPQQATSAKLLIFVYRGHEVQTSALIMTRSPGTWGHRFHRMGKSRKS